MLESSSCLTFSGFSFPVKFQRIFLCSRVEKYQNSSLAGRVMQEKRRNIRVPQCIDVHYPICCV